MTKQIRIENADTSNYKVIVQVWHKGLNDEPDSMINEHPLDYPTSMLTEYIFDTQYLVIKEAK